MFLSEHTCWACECYVSHINCKNISILYLAHWMQSDLKEERTRTFSILCPSVRDGAFWKDCSMKENVICSGTNVCLGTKMLCHKVTEADLSLVGKLTPTFHTREMFAFIKTIHSHTYSKNVFYLKYHSSGAKCLCLSFT